MTKPINKDQLWKLVEIFSKLHKQNQLQHAVEAHAAHLAKASSE